MITTFNRPNAFYLKKMKFEHRKIIHYTLLISVILLQIIAVTIWYNENKNELNLTKDIEDISSSKKIINYTHLINTSLIQSQEHFNDYLNNRDTISFKKYSNSLKEIRFLLDSIQNITNGSQIFQNIITKKDRTQAEITILKSSIDSIINNQIYKSHDDTSKLFKFTRFESKKILDSIKTDSYIKVDSVSKKGLISRLRDAFAGRLNVQKEQLNTVVTMKYKDGVVTGSIEDQLKNVFNRTNNYYQNEFINLKRSFLDLRDKDSQLIKLNNELLNISQNIISNYKNSANSLQNLNEQKIIKQYKLNKTIRNYSIILLLILMFIVSIILLNFTYLAFQYEKRLITAQNQIRQNLIFKNRIMGMISHEIRSPLSIISMYSRKVSSLIKEKELKVAFKSIEFTTNSLLLLSNQILEYSKDENKKLKLKNKNCYLKTEIYQIISSMTSLAEVKGNKINILSNLDSDCEVCTDATKIHQLFYNIIGNANKFTENGNIIVTINIQNISDYELNLKVEVIDDGIGINQNDLKNIFESYYQGTISNKVTNLGVGLGLNLCKEIVELFDGEIKVKSDEGKGTAVEFNLILSKV